MPGTLSRVMAAAMIAGLLVAATGCTTGTGTGTKTSAAAPSTSAAVSPTASPSTEPASLDQRPAEAPPAGYYWVGSQSLGIWIAAPRAWASVNLAKLNINQAVQKLFKGTVPSSTIKASLVNLRQRHALYVADLASAVSSAHQFATNANAFCSPSALLPGPAAVSSLAAVMRAEYTKIHARMLDLRKLTINGSQGIRTELSIATAAGYRISEFQVVLLTADGKLCQVTLGTDNPAVYLATLKKMSSTIHAG
jgi:hypothetical protein